MIEGQALALDTPIPTPSGWTLFGDLREGDAIFAGDGRVTYVVAITPVWTDRPCFSVVADAAQPIVADAKHKWVTSNRAERRNRDRKRTSVKTTEQIGSTLLRGTTGELFEHEIPIAGMLDLPAMDLAVDPYVLGAWLGDGDTRGHGRFTCHDADAQIVEEIRARGYEVRKVVGSYAWGIRGLRVGLRSVSVIGNKHVPSSYMRASIQQRLDLLRGLMDTDGFVSTRGQCAFDNTNLRLIEQTRELLLTLGFKPGAVQVKPRSDGHKTIYRIVFSCTATTPIPFRLARKVERCIHAVRSCGRLVRDVVSVDSVPVRCIQVAHASGTFLAGRDFVVTHNSGILTISPPWDRPRWEPSKRRLTWKNGSIATTFSADEPNALRGPQHHAGWCDELASWSKADAWDQVQLGLRLGTSPQVIVTTTPRPTPIIRDLVDQATNGGGVHITGGSTYENRKNLAGKFLDEIVRKYEGTRLGRQELYAEVLGDTPGALWTRALIEQATKAHKLKDGSFGIPRLKRVVVAVDPAVSNDPEKDGSNETGIIVVGLGTDDRVYVLDDRSGRYSPAAWAKEVVRLVRVYKADRIVAERNNGGDLVERNIRTEWEYAPYKSVWASRGKRTRAEPVAALYEQGKVTHVESFAQLEDQMCVWSPDGDEDSPDRMDALVWGITDLALPDDAPAPRGVVRLEKWRGSV